MTAGRGGGGRSFALPNLLRPAWVHTRREGWGGSRAAGRVCGGFAPPTMPTITWPLGSTVSGGMHSPPCACHAAAWPACPLWPAAAASGDANGADLFADTPPLPPTPHPLPSCNHPQPPARQLRGHSGGGRGRRGRQPHAGDDSGGGRGGVDRAPIWLHPRAVHEPHGHHARVGGRHVGAGRLFLLGRQLPDGWRAAVRGRAGARAAAPPDPAPAAARGAGQQLHGQTHPAARRQRSGGVAGGPGGGLGRARGGRGERRARRRQRRRWPGAVVAGVRPQRLGRRRRARPGLARAPSAPIPSLGLRRKWRHWRWPTQQPGCPRRCPRQPRPLRARPAHGQRLHRLPVGFAREGGELNRVAARSAAARCRGQCGAGTAGRRRRRRQQRQRQRRAVQPRGARRRQQAPVGTGWVRRGGSVGSGLCLWHHGRARAPETPAASCPCVVLPARGRCLRRAVRCTDRPP